MSLTAAERDALAIDIARRLRVLAVRPLNPELIAMLRPGAQWTFALDGLMTTGPYTSGRVEMSVDRVGSLVMRFVGPSGEVLDTVRFDPADEDWRAAAQKQ